MSTEQTDRARLLTNLATTYKRSPIMLLDDIDAEDTKQAVFEGRVGPNEGVDYRYDDALSWGIDEGYIKVIDHYTPSQAPVDKLPYYRLTDDGWAFTEPHLDVNVYRFDNTVEITETKNDRLRITPINTDSFVVDEFSVPPELGVGMYMCSMNMVAFDPPRTTLVVIVDESSAFAVRLEDDAQ